MNGGRTGKIMEAELAQPAAAPDPVAGNGIDQRADYQAVNAVRREFCTFCHSAGNNGGGCGTKYSLEDQPNKSGDVGIIIALDKEVRCADQPADVCAEHQAEAQDPEYGSADTKVLSLIHI